MGKLDRLFRTIVAVIILVLYFMDVISGLWAVVLLSLSGLYFLTSFLAYCPAYTIFKMNNCEKKRD